MLCNYIREIGAVRHCKRWRHQMSPLTGIVSVKRLVLQTCSQKHGFTWEKKNY